MHGNHVFYPFCKKRYYSFSFSSSLSWSYLTFLHGKLMKGAALPNNGETRTLQRLSHPCVTPAWSVGSPRKKGSSKWKIKDDFNLWQGKPFDNRICGWINRLTDELMNNTLTDFMSGIDSFSDQYFSYLPWCESAGIAIVNQSTSQPSLGNSALQLKKAAEIFSISSTQSYWMSLVLPSPVGSQQTRVHTYAYSCVCILISLC